MNARIISLAVLAVVIIGLAVALVGCGSVEVSGLSVSACQADQCVTGTVNFRHVNPSK